MSELTRQERFSMSRQFAKELVADSIITDAAAQFLALMIEEIHNTKIAPLQAELKRHTTLSAAMEMPEVKALVSQLEAWLEVAKHCSITEGVCCCGDNMKGHADPMDCGHTPTDHGTYHAHMLVKSTQSAIAEIKEMKP